MTKLNSADEVHRLPHTTRDIVDVICDIMDDEGPQPMRNMRPSQKHRNAADRFDEEHQGAYEERSKTNRRMVDVETHNSGYPKMHDELAKRRSTAKVAAVNLQQSATVTQAVYRKCKGCFKKRKVESRKLSKSESKKNRKTHESIIKGKSIRKQSQIDRLKVKTNKHCQCSAIFNVKDKKNGNKDNYLDDKMAAVISLPSRDFCSEEVNSDDRRSKNGSLMNPESSRSVSSYNSFGSMEQEPMVSKF